LETHAEKVVAEIAAAQVDHVNPFSGKLKVLVENRYEGNGWWVFADPATRPSFMHGYLEGSEGPQVDMDKGWDVSGVEFKCTLDFGCGVYDWRAAHFNPGN
ncbi:peptidase, partial [Rhizobiaceae sp. 2RAB30]